MLYNGILRIRIQHFYSEELIREAKVDRIVDFRVEGMASEKVFQFLVEGGKATAGPPIL